ncbi:MAG: hypothetical protein Q9226_000399 [Calogaya cf. arnoldii]
MHVTVIFDAPATGAVPPTAPPAELESVDVVPLLSPPSPEPPPAVSVSVSESVDEGSAADPVDVLLIMSSPAELGVEEAIMVMLEPPIIMEEEAIMLGSAIIMEEEGVMLESSITVEEESIILSPVSMAASESMAELAIMVAPVAALVSRLATALGLSAWEPLPFEPTPP